MIEPLIRTNCCAICSKVIDNKEYFCFALSHTCTDDNRIHMDTPKYGYFCVDCGNSLKNLFEWEDE